MPARDPVDLELGAWPLPDLAAWRRDAAALTASLTAVTLAIVAFAPLRVVVVAPGGRVALEVAGFTALASTGLLLSLGSAVVTARSAFAAALVVLGLTNLWFGVIPNLTTPTASEAQTFYPWLAARYAAGLLFLCAGLERPRWSTRTYLGASLLLVVAVVAVIAVAGPDLPVPRPPAHQGPLDLVAWHAAIGLVPLALFALGAVLAARLWLRDGQPLDRWLSFALLTGAFAQLHEILFPAAVDPLVTPADLMRLGTSGLLLVGAVQQVHRLVADRDRALVLTARDRDRAERQAVALHDHADREEAFRSLVTHELATPLATIGAYAHVLQSGASPDRTGDAAAAIGREAARLGELVQRMEELRSLEADTFTCDLRPVALRPVLEEVAAFGRALPGAHPVAVRADDLRVQADPTRLSQALRNLVSNAARYSPDGTPITLTASADGDRAVVVVADRGPGVGTADSERLFRRYERGHGTATAGTSRSGVGLYVAARLVAAHGGTIGFVDPTRPGARVRVELAVAR